MSFPTKKSLLKIILIAFVSLLCIGGVGGYFYFKAIFKAPPSELRTSQTSATIPFRWLGDTLANELNPYAAILLPVTIPGCKRIFYVQFDLGAPTSVFYGNKVDAINERYHNLSIREENGQRILSQFSFRLGDMPLAAGKIRVKNFNEKGIVWSDSSTIEIIGTIGADLIDEKVLIIDYPHQKIGIHTSLHDSINSKTTLSKFDWKERRVLLPATIDGDETILYFDTGSSAFELLTSKSNFEELRKIDGEVKHFGVNSWGNTLWAFTAATDHSITLADTSIPIKKVTYIEGTSFIQNILMRFSGMGGMTGNKLFTDNVMIIDTKRQLFGFYKY